MIKKAIEWLECNSQGRLQEYFIDMFWFYDYPFPEIVFRLWGHYWRFWGEWGEQNARVSHYSAPWVRRTGTTAYWANTDFYEKGPGVLPSWPAPPPPLFSGGDFDALMDEILAEENDLTLSGAMGGDDLGYDDIPF